MVKFARDCMVKMDQLTIELADKLGEDTKFLKMRVGIHSGSTTAGVLRGEKGRFQLFGDTGKFFLCEIFANIACSLVVFRVQQP